MEGYCVKCRMKREMQNPEKVFYGENKDRPAMKGTCPVCHCGMNVFLKRE